MKDDYFQGETLDLYGGEPTAGERRRSVQILVAIICGMLMAAGLVWYGKAYAQDLPLHVHEGEGATVKLMPGPCVDPTTLMLIAGGLPPELQVLQWRHIDSRWRMQDGTQQDFQGCWAEQGDSFVVVFSDATVGMIEKSKFKRAKGQTGI